MINADLNNMFVNKDKYYEELEKFYNEHEKSSKKPWTLEKIREVSGILVSSQEAKNKGAKRNNNQLYYSRIYETLEIGGTTAVIKKRSKEDDDVTLIIAYEEFYNTLVEIHISTGHGGRDKMLMALKAKYAIPRPAVEIFVKCCTTCAEKKQLSNKGLIVKPISSKMFNHRGQVDLIDLQSTPDGEYKWLMNYQDHLTEFIHLRPLKSKSAKNVCEELLKIFLQFGAPIVLQSGNGREFVNHIIREMIAKWPSCKIINGRPRHLQSPGSESNQDVENMLRSWLKDNNSKNWSLGCYFVQWQKNSSYHRIIKRSPYKALFGVDFQAGLFSTNLPAEIVQTINTEEELETTINNTSFKNYPESTSTGPYETSKKLNDTTTSLQIGTNHNNDEYSADINELCEIKEEPIDIDDLEENLEVKIQYNEIEHNITDVSTQKCTACNQNNSRESIAINEQQQKCDLCENKEMIKNHRKGSAKGKKRVAEKILENSTKKLKPLDIAQIVAINVPEVDIGPLDPKIILGTIVNVTNEVYQIGTKHGMLNRWFSRDEISYCQTTKKINIPEGKSISLIEALRLLSKFEGQRFKK